MVRDMATHFVILSQKEIASTFITHRASVANFRQTTVINQKNGTTTTKIRITKVSQNGSVSPLKSCYQSLLPIKRGPKNSNQDSDLKFPTQKKSTFPPFTIILEYSSPPPPTWESGDCNRTCRGVSL